MYFQDITWLTTTDDRLLALEFGRMSAATHYRDGASRLCAILSHKGDKMRILTRLVGYITIFSVLAVLSVAPGLADKPTTTSHHKTTVTAVKWPQTCPVSGSKIASVQDASGSSVYKGKTYYFCCPMCKPMFDKDPAKYVAAASKGKYLNPM
jgi:YHS domain-containing protein